MALVGPHEVMKTRPPKAAPEAGFKPATTTMRCCTGYLHTNAFLTETPVKLRSLSKNHFSPVRTLYKRVVLEVWNQSTCHSKEHNAPPHKRRLHL